MLMKRFFWPLLLVELVILTAVISAAPNSSSPLPVRFKVGVLVLPDTPNIRSDYESLALRRCLATMGIPYDVLGDFSQLEDYDLILAVGELRNTSLPFDERERLYAYVERGGVLLAYQVRGNQYYPLFGIMDHRHVVTRFRMGFESPDRDPALKYLNRPEEQEISLGDPDLFKEVISSTGYRLSTARILGRFPDGWAAFARNEYGRGLAYVLSLNLTQTILLPQMALTHEAYRQWVNSFEPSSDVLFLILRGLYEEFVRPGVRWHTVPDGKQTAFILSHDLDARESFRNSEKFARMEKQEGVTSTFFVTTKNFTDETDIGYYSGANIESLKKIKELGFDLGSHSVSHSKQFEFLQLGDPSVNSANYQPLQEKTILGEVKVSKELLDRDIPGQRTVGFRAGELAYPRRLLTALSAAGYLYDSSFSANNILSNYPFFGFAIRRLGSAETSIVEVPVTLDDSMGFLTAENRHEVQGIWEDVIVANAENNAVTCLLIHPTDTTYKLLIERDLIRFAKARDYWVGDLASFASFWAKRSQTSFEVTETEKSLNIQVNTPLAQIRPGLTLSLTSAPDVSQVSVIDQDGESVSFTPIYDNRTLLLVLQISDEGSKYKKH